MHQDSSNIPYVLSLFVNSLSELYARKKVDSSIIKHPPIRVSATTVSSRSAIGQEDILVHMVEMQ